MARKRVGPAKTGRVVAIVDDCPEYLESTETLLRRAGHEVIALGDPRTALAFLAEFRVDLILLDYFMPHMTGEELLIELRRFDPNVRVILQTGYAGEQAPDELVARLDIQGYFDKSEGPEALVRYVSEGLRSET